MIRKATTLRIKLTEQVVDARVVTIDVANDIAVLKADGDYPCLTLRASTDVALGDDVFTIGFPNPQLQGFAPKLTQGTISGTAGIQDDPRHFQVSIPVQPGNSGGPLIDDKGYAIGIVSATLSAAAMLKTSGQLPQNVNYAIKSAYILPLLEGKIPESGLPSVQQGQSKHEIIAKAQRAVGLVLVYSLPVGKPAERPKEIPWESSPPAEHTPADDRPFQYSKNDFATFLFELRTVVHRRDVKALAPLMTRNFGYALNPVREGAGVFSFWDKHDTWDQLERILNQQFVRKKDYMVAPPQFADKKLKYDGYRAGITRVNGSWKFAYFVNG